MRAFYVLLLGTSCWATTAAAQNYPADYRRACQTRDTAKIRSVLTAWRQKNPQDPNWYAAKFDYLLNRSYRVVVSTAPPTNRGMAIQGKNNQAVGSLNESYDAALLEAARATLRAGIQLAPDRLDMRFGLAKTYEMTGAAPEEIKVLQTALADRKASGRPWRWQNGGALPEPEATFLPTTLEEYMLPYWQQGGASAETARQLAELVVQYFPESAVGPFNMGLYYAAREQWPEAAAQYEQANTRKPNDWQTLANLTRVAVLRGHKAEAQQYVASLRKLPAGRPAAAALSKEIREMK